MTNFDQKALRDSIEKTGHLEYLSIKYYALDTDWTKRYAFCFITSQPIMESMCGLRH